MTKVVIPVIFNETLHLALLGVGLSENGTARIWCDASEHLAETVGVSHIDGKPTVCTIMDP